MDIHNLSFSFGALQKMVGLQKGQSCCLTKVMKIFTCRMTFLPVGRRIFVLKSYVLDLLLSMTIL